jgi:hypothetical protein
MILKRPTVPDETSSHPVIDPGINKSQLSPTSFIKIGPDDLRLRAPELSVLTTDFFSLLTFSAGVVDFDKLS